MTELWNFIIPLEQSVTGIRWTTRAERRKNDRESFCAVTTLQSNFQKLYLEKANKYWDAAQNAEKSLKNARRKLRWLK